ncbi:MAG: hypothetical protein ABT940_01355 [Alphaproteobacteria bacterium]
MDRAEATPFHTALVRWVDLCRRWAVGVVVVSLVVAVLSGVYVANHMAINSGTADMLSKDLPFRKLAREVDQAFPGRGNEIVVVVDGNIPDVVDDVAGRLAARLRERLLS